MPYKNIEDKKKHNKLYYIAHKEEHNRYHRERYAAHKEEAREYRIANTRRIWAQRSINNHRKRGMTIMISIDQLHEIATNTNECAICGTQLYWSTQQENGKACKDSPTLERINNETEIRLDNIEILCSLCNRTKSNRTREEFLVYCKMYVEKFGKDDKNEIC